MKLRVTKTSSFSYEEWIEIETLDELFAWMLKQGHEVIVDLNTNNGIPRLEIYDDYRE